MCEYSSVACATDAAAATAAAAAAAAPDGNPQTSDIVLYQFEVCPFCNKVRAFLDYHGIAYRVVEVDPLRKTELKRFSSDYRKVPIALIDGQQVNGSAAVIEAVRAAHAARGAGGCKGEALGVTREPTAAQREWLTWLDDHLIHLIAPNIYRSPTESLQTFNYIADKSKFSWWDRATIRYTGAAAMYVIGKRLKKKYIAGDDERGAMYAAVDQWMAAVSKGGGRFLEGGDQPGVADLSVYGVLKALETFDTFADIRTRNNEFAQWFDDMKRVVGEPSVFRGEE